MFLLIDNYDSFTYNLYALFRLAGAEVDVIRNTEYRNADDYKGIILSPGPSTPDNSGTTLEYLNNYTGIKPVMGVCLGMQAIAYHLGCNVRKAKSVMHGKVDNISIEKDSTLLKGIPEKFKTVRYHSLAVDVPEGIVTATAESDSECMAIEEKDKMLFGVQFHPESILAEHGDTMVKNFMKICGV
jgi:anthranilate synthase component 2